MTNVLGRVAGSCDDVEQTESKREAGSGNNNNTIPLQFLSSKQEE